MYRDLRHLLNEAEGRSEWVCAINADIRGFSRVMSGDPAQTSLYLRAVYGQILDGYFRTATFAKPTGDGLLLVIPFAQTEEALNSVTRSVVSDALQLHDDFSQIVASDKLVRFPHPKSIGIGLAVGSVSRLTAADRTIDYTGRPLNLASRLMDLARPNGVVVEATLDLTALDDATADRFTPDHVYLKGVAEQDGVDISYLSGITIPERVRHPVKPFRRQEQIVTFTRSSARTRGSRWHEALAFQPADRTQIEVEVGHPAYSASRKLVPDQRRWFDPEWQYTLFHGRPHVRLDFQAIVDRLASSNVPAGVEAELRIAYPVDDDDPDSAAV